MDIIENNKLISEFMGYDRGLSEFMGYHTSWDWLMPCVKKIRDIHNVELSIDEYSQTQDIVEMINPYDYPIEMVYASAVEFIKWYNENKEN